MKKVPLSFYFREEMMIGDITKRIIFFGTQCILKFQRAHAHSVIRNTACVPPMLICLWFYKSCNTPLPVIEDPPGLEESPILEDPIWFHDVSVLLEDSVHYFGPILLTFLVFLWRKVKDQYPNLLIADSASSHLNPATIRRLREKSLGVAIIPGGRTMHLQILDINVVSFFKQHYCDVVENWLEANGPRSKVKLSTSESRVLSTRLTKSTWFRTLSSVEHFTTLTIYGLMIHLFILVLWLVFVSIHGLFIPVYLPKPRMMITIELLEKRMLQGNKSIDKISVVIEWNKPIWKSFGSDFL